ncbi:unnamed protein product [Lactuca virosa]|uniref:Uncharacterized protein n=1 Tax=Lactuca virosa TaxID=75947 RepID=A0AAU9N1F4_9ASTR|nr:unnamed protein product [Lactuca virosa]
MKLFGGNIKDEIHPTSLEVFSAIAYQCLKNDSGKHPLMEDVVTELEIAFDYQCGDKDIVKADTDHFVEDGSLDDNVESFLFHDDTDPRDAVGSSMDVSKEFTFAEVNSVRASARKVICCHFSPDDSLKPKTTLEEHSSLITDVRFSPSMPRLATSSFDKTVCVWDADNPGFSLRTFIGHSASVMSLDFHPNKDDLICSCDGDGEIRYWSINNGSCSCVFKGHRELIHSVCLDPNGEYLVSVSQDSVRVWSFMAGNEGECIHDLSCNGNKFHFCVFHGSYASLLVIGCYQSLELWNMSQNKTMSLELWNMSQNKTMTLSAHEGLIASLAMSTATGLVASASHDKIIKLWK